MDIGQVLSLKVFCKTVSQGCITCSLSSLTKFSQNFIHETVCCVFRDIRDKNDVNQGFLSKTAVSGLPATKNHYPKSSVLSLYSLWNQNKSSKIKKILSCTTTCATLLLYNEMCIINLSVSLPPSTSPGWFLLLFGTSSVYSMVLSQSSWLSSS